MIRGRSELERRGRYIELLESPLHPGLVQLVKQCLHNVPGQRPSTDELLAALQRMKVEVEGEYGIQIRLDMEKLRLAKEVKLKERRIGELTQLQVIITCTKTRAYRPAEGWERACNSLASWGEGMQLSYSCIEDEMQGVTKFKSKSDML